MHTWLHNFWLPFLIVLLGYVAGTLLGNWYTEMTEKAHDEDEKPPL